MKKLLLLSLLILLASGVLILSEYRRLFDGKVHIVFCNVGQGDSILVITPHHKHVLIDGGPDKRVLDCLTAHQAFWEKTIDVLLLTHPHADHVIGMHYVVDRYTVKYFVTEELDNKTAAFHGLLEKLHDQHITEKIVYAGDQFAIDFVQFRILGPTHDYLSQTSPNGMIGENKEFASLITKLVYGKFSAIFTGDSQAEGLHQALSDLSSITILQSPHHGSATGLDNGILAQLSPQFVAISVGKNTYGHPAPSTLGLFSQHNISFLRTDKAGDIDISSNGAGWQVQRRRTN